jgi:hypothetical protein
VILAAYCIASIPKSPSIGLVPFSTLSLPLKTLEIKTFQTSPLIDRITIGKTTVKVLHGSNRDINSAICGLVIAIGMSSMSSFIIRKRKKYWNLLIQLSTAPVGVTKYLNTIN